MKSVVILSGGLDSTVLLYVALDRDASGVGAISVHYGQRHGKELDFARETCRRLGVPHEVVDLGSLRPVLAGSSQTSDEVPVPEGHYAEETMKATVVPNRNMILLAVAAGYAIGKGARTIAYAAHGGDHAIYPDCRPEFVEAMAHALSLADWHRVEIRAPFLVTDKAGIVRIGSKLGVPFERTWSCYKGGDRHCGWCGTCVERREAFALAGVPDPTEYQ